MLRISKKVEYALISLIHLADLPTESLQTSRELSQQFNIPQEIIGKVLQALARNNFVESVQGAKGGYRLARDPNEIRLTGIINALDGPMMVVNCLDDLENCACDQKNYCNVRNPMEVIQSKLVQLFNSISVRDLQLNSISDAGEGITRLPVNFIDIQN